MASLLVCGIYYVFWMFLLPKWGNYAIRTQLAEVGNNGAKTHTLVKVPLSELEKWDEEHDETGNLRRRHVPESDSSFEV